MLGGSVDDQHWREILADDDGAPRLGGGGVEETQASAQRTTWSGPIVRRPGGRSRQAGLASGSAARSGTRAGGRAFRGPASGPGESRAARRCPRAADWRPAAPAYRGAQGASTRPRPVRAPRLLRHRAPRSRRRHGAASLRSCVMKSSAVPCSRCSRRNDLHDRGLGGDIERRRRFVGHHQRRIAGERHGDQHALVHAARELEG